MTFDQDWEELEDEFRETPEGSHVPIGYWRTKEGKTVKITDMNAVHLNNAVKYCARHGRQDWVEVLEAEQRRRADEKKLAAIKSTPEGRAFVFGWEQDAIQTELIDSMRSTIASQSREIEELRKDAATIAAERREAQILRREWLQISNDLAAARAEIEELRKRLDHRTLDWSDEVRTAVSCLEAKWDIEVCSIEFAAKLDEARQKAESDLTAARKEIVALRDCIIDCAGENDMPPHIREIIDRGTEHYANLRVLPKATVDPLGARKEAVRAGVVGTKDFHVQSIPDGKS